MSYSYPVDEGPEGGLEDRINVGINNLPHPEQREQAQADAPDVVRLVRDKAARLGAERFTASVSGHTDKNSSMTNVTVYRKDNVPASS